MPEICRFLGIIIRMYIGDHAPPHIHVQHNEFEVRLYLEDGRVEGQFPRNKLKKLEDWYRIHKDELLANWQLAINNQPINKIEPLDE